MPRFGDRIARATAVLAVAICSLVTACTGSGIGQAAGPRRAVAGGGASAPASAPASMTVVPVGRSTQTIDSGGVQRTVHLYRPAGLTGAVPLVVMLHGGYGGGTQAETAYHWDAEADRGRFVAAFPDGTNASWNAGGGCCGPAVRNGVDDVTFLKRMVAALRGELDIDQNRIYVSGVSNGGAMAYRMACETDLFAAVGVDSTTMLVDCANARPTSILHIHGTADPRIPYQGGKGQPYSRKSPPIDGPPVPSVNATWRQTDHCSPPATTTAGTVTTSTATCPAGRTVELITIAGAGHGWPGATPNPLAEKLLHTEQPSTALNATDEIWQFFAAHRK